MQSQKQGNLFLLLVIVLAAVSGFLFVDNKISKFQYGLDIQGGVQLTYRMKTEELKKQPTPDELAEMQRNLSDILGNRAGQALGVVEATVGTKGTDSVFVELPGYTNADEARKTMSTTASIKMYHARSVTTERDNLRRYTEVDRTDDGGSSPAVNFVQKSTGKVLTPKDPEYKTMIGTWDLILEGSDLQKASVMLQGNGAQPQFRFSSAGAAKLETWCRKFLTGGEKLAFVLDGVVLSCNPKAEGEILNTEAVLQGSYSPTYAGQLISLLNSGALPVSLEETSNQTLDPTLGKDAMQKMLFAGFISFGVIVLFMLYYYGFPGAVAFVALLLYILFTLTVMKLTSTTFSLAAIAGFILSIGMAVDANILVFERMKEEMREGRSLMTAVQLGFKRALTAIIDSNVCTIITSSFLALFGTGLVKGFATSLIIGVCISLFTAITVTRSLLVFFVGSGIIKSEKLLLPQRNWFGEKFETEAATNPIPIVRKSKKYFIISIISIIPGLVMLFMGGLKPNVEFTGGVDAIYKAGDSNRATVLANLEKGGYAGANAKYLTAAGQKLVSITIPGVKSDDLGAYDKIGTTASLEATETKSFTAVGPTLKKEALEAAYKSIGFSSLAIVLYLSFRFGIALGGIKNGLKFGLSAIAALLHDILFVIGIAAIVGKFMGWEVSSLFVTAMLTVIGFSVHDTIVIFDRIRENLRKPQPGEDFMHLCDRSISQSLARSLNTAGTVIVTLIIMIAFGTPTIDLKFFCVTMLAGIISGTYSSIFNATPILYLWDKANEKSKGPAATLIHQSTAELARARAAAMATTVGGGAVQPGQGQAGRGYGTIKRKNEVEKSEQELD
ncbi:MAG: protein translocase subunit SecD [Chthonomonas sp.]|nr:protein translocase subunit SecD [Chthonomonas sp.]